MNETSVSSFDGSSNFMTAFGEEGDAQHKSCVSVEDGPSSKKCQQLGENGKVIEAADDMEAAVTFTAKMVSAVKEYKERVNSLKATNAELLKKLAEKDNAIGRLEGQKKQLESSLPDLRAAIEKYSAVEEKLGGMRRQVEAMKRELERKTDENANQAKDVEMEAKVMKEKHEQEIQNLRSQFQLKISTLKEENAKYVNSLKKDNEDLEKKLLRRLDETMKEKEELLRNERKACDNRVFHLEGLLIEAQKKLEAKEEKIKLMEKNAQLKATSSNTFNHFFIDHDEIGTPIKTPSVTKIQPSHGYYSLTRPKSNFNDTSLKSSSNEFHYPDIGDYHKETPSSTKKKRFGDMKKVMQSIPHNETQRKPNKYGNMQGLLSLGDPKRTHPNSPLSVIKSHKRKLINPDLMTMMPNDERDAA